MPQTSEGPVAGLHESGHSRAGAETGNSWAAPMRLKKELMPGPLGRAALSEVFPFFGQGQLSERQNKALMR